MGGETFRRDLKGDKELPHEGLGEGQAGLGGPASTKGLRRDRGRCVQETERPVWQLNAIRWDIREHS